MVWVLCIFVLFFSSCEQKSQERHYTEIVLEAPQVNSPNIPAATGILSWAVPQGWKEEPGEGMRLATFYLIADPDAIDCSIVSLAGPVGGLNANLERWLRQLGLQASDDSLNQLTSSVQILKTKDGLEIKVFDFTTLQTQGLPSDKSMIAAMIVLDQTTVFVKMTGSVESVEKNKVNFLKLLGSFVRN